MIVITDERCTAYAAAGHPERPARISRTAERLREQKAIPVQWAAPAPANETQILRAHDPRHLEAVKQPAWDFDADTAAYPQIYEHALRSVGGGLQALAAARNGELAFSLLRPPGHHATRNRAMGFCYLNTIAITVLEALATGTRQVAVYDFDVHHGNGTEAILQDHPGVTFHSIHQSPCYPGTGTSDVGTNCFNYPVRPQTPRDEYRKVLARALADLQQSGPELVAVSAGFDAYEHDPIAQETLTVEDFHWIGQQLRALQLPSLHCLEGGYSSDLPELILAYLKGLLGQ